MNSRSQHIWFILNYETDIFLHKTMQCGAEIVFMFLNLFNKALPTVQITEH